ncbi:MAG: mannose-1-phosphate guanylyltransferase [Bacteroidales bacterium]|nr:mannose-1-phosphate guanylyltransferase [Bacteroidales bacterium]
MNTHVVIMAGGIGSRLWPLSTPETPKQFIDILGVGQSLLQLTVERFLPVCPPDRFWVVTSEKYVDIVRQQLPAVPDDQILAEPEARNTAPCIAYASWKISRKDPDANIVVTPADALVLKTFAFTETIRKALTFTEVYGGIVTVGIAPTRPETGYGYIHAAEAVQGRVVKVSEFWEKPDLATAEAYLADGHYFWNAGIFVWKVSTIVEELRAHAPQIAGVMDRLAPSFFTEGEAAALKELFPTCEKVSIDYAVMEKSGSIHVIAADLGWSDLGSWGSIKTHVQPDADGNAVIGGDVRLFGCKDCFVHTAGEKTVVVEGLDGYIVAESAGRLLVCRLSEEQRIKEFSSEKN